jgi:hypothetical protein
MESVHRPRKWGPQPADTADRLDDVICDINIELAETLDTEDHRNLGGTQVCKNGVSIQFPEFTERRTTVKQGTVARTTPIPNDLNYYHNGI